MKSIHLLPIFGYGLMVFSACGVEEEAEKRPNILFILSDDHSREAVSAYGGINARLAPTPHIDGIGKDGVVMRNMLCTNSISGPSRACLLTGKYSTTNGLDRKSTRLNSSH